MGKNAHERCEQLPVVSNSCAMGHKLQGCTVENTLANDMSHQKNWACVVLSRVKTMAGLFLRVPLDTNLKQCAKPKKMLEMLQGFRDRLSVATMSDDDYKLIIEAEESDA